MALASTAFTPIVTRNEPPFGFHEVQTPTDFKRCNENPYIGTEQLKASLNARFAELEKKRAQERCRSLEENYENYYPKNPADLGHQSSGGMLKWIIWILIASFACKLLSSK